MMIIAIRGDHHLAFVGMVIQTTSTCEDGAESAGARREFALGFQAPAPYVYEYNRPEYTSHDAYDDSEFRVYLVLPPINVAIVIWNVTAKASV